MPDIKTKDVVLGTIKTVDRSALAGQRMKDAYVHARNKAEQSVSSSESNSEEYLQFLQQRREKILRKLQKEAGLAW